MQDYVFGASRPAVALEVHAMASSDGAVDFVSRYSTTNFAVIFGWIEQ